MNKEYINKIAELWQQVAEKKTLDPVDPKALKGKHADRKDKDIDNDGDVDKSDEYLHKRRQAVSKAMKNESEDEMKPCPKCDGSMQNHDPDCPMADNDDDDDMEKDESCGKKMKKESVEVDEGAFKGVGKFIAKRKFANKSKQAYKDAQKSISKAHKYNFDDVKNREPHEKDFTDKMKKSDRYDRAAKRLNRESVSHQKWGYGEVIETTENGFNVYFEHGVEFNVPFEDLTMIGEAKKMKGDDPCWKDYEMVGTKKKNGKEVPNCVPKESVKEGTVTDFEEEVKSSYVSRSQSMHDAIRQVWEGAVQAKQGVAGKYQEKQKGDPKRHNSGDKMPNDHDYDNPEMTQDDAQGHYDATKAGRVTKQAPTRGGEKRIGDKSIINPVKGAVTKTTGKE